nr:PLP-dependent aminotransferase family protein [Conyzicola lurida]
MLDSWRASGSTPAYEALADRIRLLILDGRIALGVRLPAERDLAAQLGVSRTTVAAAYAELRDRDYLTSVRGSGSIARQPHGVAAPNEAPSSGILDFSKASLPALQQLADAAATAVEQLPAYLGGTGFDPVGLPVLRQALADRYTSRGLPTSPDQIMVTIGAQHAIALLARTLLGRGDRALVEAPSYPHAIDALKAAGARLVPVSVTTHDGWDEEALEQAFQRTSPSLGYLMPDFHNPTGRSMSAALREKTLALAARQGTTLIADETIGELGMDDVEPVLPFAAYGAVDTQAILVGSVGKTVWGGVRVGWIRAERSVIQRLIRERASGDLGTPALEQLIVTNLLGDYDSVLETRRRQLRAGRHTLARLLAEKIPEWEMPHVAGGLTAWVNLGAPVSSQLTLAARNEGLQIAAGPRFGIDGAFERFLRIPFSYSESDTERAVDALAVAWRNVGRHSIADTGWLAEVV